jgi:hypothetical protein
MKGNFHVRFLEGWGPVMALGYSATRRDFFPNRPFLENKIEAMA